MGHILDELNHFRQSPPVGGNQPQGSLPLGSPLVAQHPHDYALPSGSDLAGLIRLLQTRPTWVANNMLIGPMTPAAHHTTHDSGGSDGMVIDAAAATGSLRTLGVGAAQAAAGNDSRLSDARTPTAHHVTHDSGGTDGMVIDAAAGTGSLRTLGATALKACAGNDSRLSDARTPTAHHTTHDSGGSDGMVIDAAAATGSLRTLGSGALQATAGNDSRLSDARTPTAHHTTHDSGGSDGMVIDAAAATGSLRTLGTGALQAAPGNDSRFTDPAKPVVATFEANLGTKPLRAGHFSITGLSGLTTGKPVLVQKAVGPYTGKGTRQDEAEMDQVSAQGIVISATQIDIYWQSHTFVQAKIKFDYAVGG
jgi:hypothetical protein